MASIPHGTTIVAQGLALPAIAGKPTIDPIDITPFAGGNPGNKIPFQNQTATNKTTRRIPQDLAALIASGKITQTILDNPATILNDQITHQTITQTIVIVISTNPGSPLPGGPLRPGNPSSPAFGGGTSDIAFLLGQANPPAGGPNSNANAFQMDAVFWIETVIYDVQVPPLPRDAPNRARPGTEGVSSGRPELPGCDTFCARQGLRGRCGEGSGDSDPVFSKGHAGFQRTDLAARVRRIAGSGRACTDSRSPAAPNVTGEQAVCRTRRAAPKLVAGHGQFSCHDTLCGIVRIRKRGTL